MSLDKIWEIYTYTAQKMKFSVKDFFSKCRQILRKLWIWSHLLKKSLMESFIFCAVLAFSNISIDTELVNKYVDKQVSESSQ